VSLSLIASLISGLSSLALYTYYKEYDPQTEVSYELKQEFSGIVDSKPFLKGLDVTMAQNNYYFPD
jgi:hypothetical protein